MDFHQTSYVHDNGEVLSFHIFYFFFICWILNLAIPTPPWWELETNSPYHRSSWMNVIRPGLWKYYAQLVQLFPFSSGQVRNLYLFVLGQGLQSSSKEEYLENKCCGYSLEVHHWGPTNEYQQHLFSSRNKKNVIFWASKSWLEKWISTIYLSVEK